MNPYCGSLWTHAVVRRGHELWFAMTRTAADRGLLAEFAGHIVFFKLYYNVHIDILAASFFFFSIFGERSDYFCNGECPSTGNRQSILTEQE